MGEACDLGGIDDLAFLVGLLAVFLGRWDWKGKVRCAIEPRALKVKAARSARTPKPGGNSRGVITFGALWLW
jgi:hypothetical protein